ncbi:hypothetical protein D3C84_1309900 [compost metagenome]
MNQPLFGRLIRRIVLNNERRRFLHRGDFLALVDTTEKVAGGFGAIEDQHPGSLVEGWR